jgi:hypothetical protein
MWKKILRSWTGKRWKYGACALHAGYLRLQTHTQSIYNLLLCNSNNGCMIVPQCYVTRTLPLCYF